MQSYLKFFEMDTILVVAIQVEIVGIHRFPTLTKTMFVNSIFIFPN